MLRLSWIGCVTLYKSLTLFGPQFHLLYTEGVCTESLLVPSYSYLTSHDSFSHLHICFDKCLLCTHYMPGALLGSNDKMGNRTERVSAHTGARQTSKQA